jgi:GTP 3',8-cyclase
VNALALRISVTDRCQLRCRYCMPPEGIACGCHSDILSYEEITQLVRLLQKNHGIHKIRLTGGEPLIRPQIETLIAMLSDIGIPDIALTTNALKLAPLATKLKAAGLNRINISLDALSPETFGRITGSQDVQSVLDGISAAKEAGLQPIKLNTVVIKGENDHELIPIVHYALANGLEVRFIELMPIGPGVETYQDGFLSSADVRKILETAFLLTPATNEPGSSARRFQVTDQASRTSTTGFISSCSNPFCSGCRRLRITARGELIGCLAREDGIPIRPLLQQGNDAAILHAVQTAMGGKRANTLFEQARSMSRIGG